MIHAILQHDVSMVDPGEFPAMSEELKGASDSIHVIQCVAVWRRQCAVESLQGNPFF